MSPPAALPFDLSRLHAEVTGPEDAPPLLVLHGWGSSAAMMRPIVDVLKDRFRVHNLDLPGHGQTAPPPEPWGVPDYAALVIAYLDAHGIAAPLPAIGHSNGGRILLHLTSDPATAHRFSKLVLVSPSGVRRMPSAKTRAKRLVAKTLQAPFRLLPQGPLRDACFDWLRHSLVWRLLGSADYNRLSGVMRETFVRTVGHLLDEKLHTIRVPVLVFWGDQDLDIVRQQVDTLVEKIPDAGLVVLEGAGHYGYLDRMDLFEAATRHFLLETPAVEAAPEAAHAEAPRVPAEPETVRADDAPATPAP